MAIHYLRHRHEMRINLVFSTLEGETYILCLKKINYEFQRNEDSLNEEIKIIIDQCFNENFVDENKFIMTTIRKKIHNLSLLFETNEANQGSGFQQLGFSTDSEIFEILSNLILQTDINEFASYPAGELKQLPYLYLVCFGQI
jgi:hypothetical protein